MRRIEWLGMVLAAGLGLAGCAGTGVQMPPEKRQAMTDEMLGTDSFATGYIDGDDGDIGTP